MKSKPLFREVHVPRDQFLTDEGYRLHVAEERVRVKRNVDLMVCIGVVTVIIAIGYIAVAFVGMFISR